LQARALRWEVKLTNAYRETGQKQRCIREFCYAADSWNRKRRYLPNQRARQHIRRKTVKYPGQSLCFVHPVHVLGYPDNPTAKRCRVQSLRVCCPTLCGAEYSRIAAHAIAPLAI
jgi:hypothetical protein